MKNKYNSIYSTCNDYNDSYKHYGEYINITDFIKEYNGYWVDYTPKTSEEKLAREKMEKRNEKINLILNESGNY